MPDTLPVSTPNDELWPALPLDAWQDTYETLHRWTQIVGKVRMALTPMRNHWWQVPLYVTPRGLTTSPIPYGERCFEIDFDFTDHALRISTSEGTRRAFELQPMAVAVFYRTLMDELRALGIEVEIWPVPVEIEDRTPFDEDYAHAAYDPVYARRHWQVLVQADRVLKAFSARFTGKVSPVHFFWGSFDLAVTRFSGRRAPVHPGGPNVAAWVMREAYSHEVSSCGFWPGAGTGAPTFYAYAYPEPDGFKTYPVQPAEASYDAAFGEFLLPYEAVRRAASPDEMLMSFLQTTYEAAAVPGNWDRAALER
ncbi:MAG TPA: DUF5996 family protein [Aggregatilinea sp.]|uniref:DUF5996 family protein n=1 Tax=Aggregatilinea sp. TaxID=2806333 RepID=UPI002C49F3A9|nr:DUF5996 family protein [Aggregatilinea sp.]HML21355.1 DUF5996 family protein [Aggregatilinea sp.]